MRITQIQGLRALAAILVTVFHAKFITGGFIGVDIFYVISGYLITGLILREIDRSGEFGFKKFYARRSKRLLPTSAFVLVVTAIVSFLILPATMRQSLGRDIIAASLYISNYLFAWWQNDYQNLNATPSPVIHFWSLAVEEQFYFIWPLFIFALTRFRRKAIVVAGVLLLTLGSLVFSMYQTETAPIWAFYSLPTRAWELGVGALLVFLPTMPKNRWIPWIGFIALTYSSMAFSENTAFPGKAALLPVLGTFLLISSIKYWPPIFNDLANSKVSQWLGEISYPLYLWHWPLLVLPSTYLSRPLTFPEKFGCIALTIAFADLTHRFIEERFRHRETTPSKVFKSVGAITLISIILGTGIYFTNTQALKITGVQGEVTLERIKSSPQIYDDGCHVFYGKSLSGECTYGDVKSSRTIVLYGDSHAAQWFPAIDVIAQRSGYKLISLTKSACPSIDVTRPDKGAFKMSDCTKWRENSIARINSIRPDAIIMSSFQYFAPPSNVTNRALWWSDGQKRLLNSIRKSSPLLIYIVDTPRPTRDIPSCLVSQEISVCNKGTASQPLATLGFQVINPNPWLCSSICPAVLDGIVAYRDDSHISVDIATALIPRLNEALATAGLPL